MNRETHALSAIHAMESENSILGALLLDNGESFRSLRLSTWGVAVEVDNFAVGVGVRAVPEPATLALVGMGVLGFVATRRRRSGR